MTRTIKTLDIQGYAFLDWNEGNDIEIYKDLNDNVSESFSELFFDSIEKISGKEIPNLSFLDWRKGEHLFINEVFIRYYFAKEKCTWEEVKSEHIKTICGACTANKVYDGYSEWTVMDSYMDILFGEKNLFEEIKSSLNKRYRYPDGVINYKSMVEQPHKYLLFRMDFKINA